MPSLFKGWTFSADPLSLCMSCLLYVLYYRLERMHNWKAWFILKYFVCQCQHQFLNPNLFEYIDLTWRKIKHTQLKRVWSINHSVQILMHWLHGETIFIFQYIFLFFPLTPKSWSEFYWLLFRSLSSPYEIIYTNFKWKKLMLNSIITSHWSWAEITQINKDLYYEMHLLIRLQSMFRVLPFEHEMHWDTQKECGELRTRSLAE